MDLLSTALGAIVAFLATGAVAAVIAAMKRRVKFQTPEAEIVEKIVPTVNALLAMQGPQTEALIAILEAQKGICNGICNGNVDQALVKIRTSKAEFDAFLLSTAQVDFERA